MQIYCKKLYLEANKPFLIYLSRDTFIKYPDFQINIVSCQTVIHIKTYLKNLFLQSSFTISLCCQDEEGTIFSHSNNKGKVKYFVNYPEIILFKIISCSIQCPEIINIITFPTLTSLFSEQHFITCFM